MRTMPAMQKLALVVLLLAATSAFAQLEAPAVLKLQGMENVDVRANVRYDGERTFDLYRPNGSKDALPLVVFINGVGRPDLKDWGQYTSWPRLAAVRGMAAISYQTAGEQAGAQTEKLLQYVNEHASELKIDPNRIAIWACSANGRVGTDLVARQPFRAAVFYYAIMPTAAKAEHMPVLVTRAGLDTTTINDSIDQWVAGALKIDAPVTLINYPEGLHGFDLRNDTAESKDIIRQTLDFLHFNLNHARTPSTEPLTPVQLSRIVRESGIDAAIVRLRELRKMHPNALVVQEQQLNTMGYAYLGDRKTAEAVKVLELAAALYPDSPNAHDSLGDAYAAAGRNDDAVKAAERAIQLLPNAPAQQRDGIRRSAEEKLARLKKPS